MSSFVESAAKGAAPPAAQTSKGPIYTLGTSDNSPEDFLQLLGEYGIQVVVDVRRFPSSRFPHFNSEALAQMVRQAGFDYVYLGAELGGYRSGGYEAYMLTEEFKHGIEELERIAEGKAVAVVCAERLPWKCHRRFIGFELMERGWQVIHIIDRKRTWRFRGSPEA